MVEDDDDEEEEGDFEARRGEARSCPTGEARTCSRGAALKSVPIVEGEAGGTSVAVEPHERGWGLWSWGAVSRIIDGVPFPPPSMGGKKKLKVQGRLPRLEGAGGPPAAESFPGRAAGPGPAGLNATGGGPVWGAGQEGIEDTGMSCLLPPSSCSPRGSYSMCAPSRTLPIASFTMRFHFSRPCARFYVGLPMADILCSCLGSALGSPPPRSGGKHPGSSLGP